jgi:hypothetical protein
MGACNSASNKQKKDELERKRLRQEQLRQDFIKELVEEHNKFRLLHGVPPLKHDEELTKFSQEHATKLAQRGVQRASICKHEDRIIGENVTMSGGSALTPKKVIDIWYKEYENYNFSEPESSAGANRFTQLVWKNTETVGVGIATLGQSTYVVTNYHPCGNKKGEYALNVFPKQAEM